MLYYNSFTYSRTSEKLSSLNPHFLIYDIGMIIQQLSRMVRRYKDSNSHKVFTKEPCLQYVFGKCYQ